MKNKYICASCAHILGEKNQTLPEQVLTQFNFLQTNGKICSICGQKPFWNGKPLTLTLDHIDGDNTNDVLTNLRWVCPNCDRQLDTFGSKNKRQFGSVDD